MTDHNVTHGTFSLDRTYDASPARVFSAFSDPEKKRHWFTGFSDAEQQSFEFRVGGHETSRGKMPNGGDMRYDAVYLDIVEESRIIYAYEMSFGGQRISGTLATIELSGTDAGTHLKLTEQSAFLDGFDGPKYWESGTTSLLDRLGKFLDQKEENDK